MNSIKITCNRYFNLIIFNVDTGVMRYDYALSKPPKESNIGANASKKVKLSGQVLYMIKKKNQSSNYTFPQPKKSIYSCYIKRFIDVVLSSVVLLGLSPLLAIISLLVWLFHGRPILYISFRPGKDGQLFKMYKFRSMLNKTDVNGVLLPEKERLTKLGKLLRRLSLDELPELFNIIKGDMAIVGPRPLLPEYLDLYTERHSMRHSVRPGLACVRLYKKNEAHSKTWTWREQFENDIFYIQNISFMLDVQMVFAIAREALVGSDTRTDDTRIRFDGQNLDDTRTKQEAMMDYERVKII
jgi:undecaprenyl phosphate N,N'-diacetylbacillosamine 1-phosphate transferase